MGYRRGEAGPSGEGISDLPSALKVSMPTSSLICCRLPPPVLPHRRPFLSSPLLSSAADYRLQYCTNPVPSKPSKLCSCLSCYVYRNTTFSGCTQADTPGKPWCVHD